MVTRGIRCRLQDCHLLWCAFPGTSANDAFVTALGFHNPRPKAGLGYVRVRSPLLTESRLISFPPGTEMCQFPGLARAGLYIQPAVTPSPCGVTPGFPIRTSPDQCSFDSSPELIAAYHVFHRLWTPRHPPCTLTSLITFMNRCRWENPSIDQAFACPIPGTLDGALLINAPSRRRRSIFSERPPVLRPTSIPKRRSWYKLDLVIQYITYPLYSIVKEHALPESFRTRQRLETGR